MKEKVVAAIKRSAWTAAEVALAMIPFREGLEEVNWLHILSHILSVVATATIISFLKSVVLSMPEVKLAEALKTEKVQIEEKSNDNT